MVVGLFVATPTSLSLDVLHKYWKVHMKKTETSGSADKMDGFAVRHSVLFFRSNAVGFISVGSKPVSC